MHDERRERGVALAALLVALVVWGVSAGPFRLPDLERDPLDCAIPQESAGRDGRTTALRCAAEGEPRLRGPVRLLFGEPLDVNRAPAASLEVLPGIGPARARAIVRERERGPFRTVADLQRVHGIGPRTIERLAGLVAAADGVVPPEDAPSRDAGGEAG